MSLSFFGCRIFADPLELGSPLPEVELHLEDGQVVQLRDVSTEGFVFVYFYPKSFTGGCTAQACSLRDSWADLSEVGVQVFGVSSDSVETQKRFREAEKLPFQLVADTEGAVAAAFGSRSFSRQAYLFKEGILVWRDLRASTRKQAEDVLEAIAGL